jgi:hypothetical protein
MRRTSGILTALALTGALLLPLPLHAQQSPQPTDATQVERNPPVFPWVVALVAVLVVMLIMCMPSRKAT